jgi:hypothetical protein
MYFTALAVAISRPPQHHAQQMYVKLPQNLEKKSLWEDLEKDSSFLYGRYVRSRLDRAGFLASLCYQALNGNRYASVESGVDVTLKRDRGRLESHCGTRANQKRAHDGGT